ncbi:hypothetical protein DXU77_13095 [Pseudomonas lactis]|uniref:hypothetical protein n=1 Tax=Pseudomonas lactis TaxID=1615674 RepID=UPI0012952759|nr:hypothetical protein [Pseudomonas lactis]MQB16013.1 hypothetical protein [Pseudomonas lactis]
MIIISVNVRVTGKKKSIPKNSRDGVGRKKIGLDAVWGMTVTAFLGWVIRKTISLFWDGFDV